MIVVGILLHRLIIFILNILGLSSCCHFDPVCEDQTSMAPSKFWHPTDDHCEGTTAEDWQTEKNTPLCSIQRKDVQIIDLLDIALQLNPNTQFTWANARAAAYNVEVQRSALYPTIEVQEEYNISDTRYDDGDPFDDVNAIDATLTTKAQLAAFLSVIRKQKNGSSSSSFIPPPRLNGPGLIPGILDFQSPVREQAVNQILNRHQTVTNVNRTGNVVNTAGQAANAALANNAAGQALGVGGTRGIGTSRTLLHDLSISYLLLDFGGRDASIEAARQALYNSDWIHNRQIQQVIITVLRNYYNLVGILSLLEARQSDLKNAQTNYESARQLFDAGIRNKLDVLQAQTDLINIQLNIVDLEGQKKVAYGNLANAMGLSAHAEFNIPEIPDDLVIDVSVGNVDQLIQEAVKVRADLAAAYAEHEQRKAQVIIARSQGLPTINTQFDLQSFNDTINPSFNTHSISGSVFLNIPIFSGFLYVSQEREAKEIVKAASANVRNTELLVTLDVLTSYYNFKTAVQSLHFSEDFLKYSLEAYEAALATYQEGISTILDLLTAQRSLATAKAQRIQARTNWAIALSNISFAVGTLGTESEIKPWEQRQVLKGRKHEK